jgi:hypothetical protein
MITEGIVTFDSISKVDNFTLGLVVHPIPLLTYGKAIIEIFIGPGRIASVETTDLPKKRTRRRKESIGTAIHLANVAIKRSTPLPVTPTELRKPTIVVNDNACFLQSPVREHKFASHHPCIRVFLKGAE